MSQPLAVAYWMCHNENVRIKVLVQVLLGRRMTSRSEHATCLIVENSDILCNDSWKILHKNIDWSLKSKTKRQFIEIYKSVIRYIFHFLVRCLHELWQIYIYFIQIFSSWYCNRSITSANKYDTTLNWRCDWHILNLKLKLIGFSRFISVCFCTAVITRKIVSVLCIKKEVLLTLFCTVYIS